MKEIVRAANKIMVMIPESLWESWGLICHDTETFKNMTDDEMKEAQEHLQMLMDGKVE